MEGIASYRRQHAHSTLNRPTAESEGTYHWSERLCSRGPGGGGYPTNVYTGKLRPEAQPLTLLYTIFYEKGSPFVYLY